MASFRRLGYVDWARGLAVYVMIQTHTYSSWLSPEAKQRLDDASKIELGFPHEFLQQFRPGSVVNHRD